MEMPELPQPMKRPAEFVPARNWADPEVVIEEGRDFIRSLSRADRVAFFAAIGAMLSCICPWKETVTDGEVIGLVCSGLFTFFAALICAIAVGLRVRGSLQRTNPLYLWMAQLISAASGTLWSIVFMPLNYDSTLVTAVIGNSQVAISRPSYGAVLGVVLSGVAVGGTLMSLKERR
jgi:hypothetical protein